MSFLVQNVICELKVTCVVCADFSVPLMVPLKVHSQAIQGILISSLFYSLSSQKSDQKRKPGKYMYSLMKSFQTKK